MRPELYEAIFRRHSTRAYDGRMLLEEHAATVREACAEPLEVARGTRVALVIGSAGQVFTGLAVRNVPAFLVMLGDPAIPQVETWVGYRGEYVVLAATAAGLESCWMTATFRPDVAAELVGLQPGERVFAVSPLGYGGHPSVVETFFNRVVTRSRERKAWSELLAPAGTTLPDRPSWMRTALEAARLAPSAYNRQPWRFRLGVERITVSLDLASREVPTASRNLDCGIAMLHLELGAQAQGVTGTWKLLDSPEVAVYTA